MTGIFKMISEQYIKNKSNNNNNNKYDNKKVGSLNNKAKWNKSLFDVPIDNISFTNYVLDLLLPPLGIRNTNNNKKNYNEENKWQQEEIN